MFDNFYGKSFEYWLELEKRSKENKLDNNLLEEVIQLRGKVSYYESRIKEMYNSRSV